MASEHYTYRITWSAEDEEYVATCAEFPSLSWLDPDQLTALSSLKVVVADTVRSMEASGELVPVAFADRTYSGKLTLRVPPQLHQRLVIEAAEEHVSLSRHMNMKLAAG